MKPWGRWATLGLGLIAMLIGQMAALAVLIWGIGLSLAQVPDMASDGVAVILIVCISTPVQVLVLALMARQTGASATDYLALRLPRKIEVVAGFIAILILVVVGDGVTWLTGRDNRQPISTRHLSHREHRGLSAVAMAHCSGNGADWRRNTISRLSVSRLAPRTPRCLARDHRHCIHLGR